MKISRSNGSAFSCSTCSHSRNSGVRAVSRTLREAVTGDEFEDVPAQLPREYTTVPEESD
jgi:uncharacterized protein (DUF2267 family)